MEKLKENIKKEASDKYVSKIESLITDDITSIDVAAALFGMMLKDQNAEKNSRDVDLFANSYEGGSDGCRRNFSDSSSRAKGGKRRRGGSREAGMTRLFVSIGRNKNVRPGDFVGAIAGETGLKGEVVGEIDIFDKYSFVEVPDEHANTVIEALNNSNIKGHRVNVEKAGK